MIYFQNLLRLFHYLDFNNNNNNYYYYYYEILIFVVAEKNLMQNLIVDSHLNSCIVEAASPANNNCLHIIPGVPNWF